MPYKLLPLPQTELSIYFRVTEAAFRNPGILDVMFPDPGNLENRHQHHIEASKRSFARYPGRYHYFKVIDTDLPENDSWGQVVGVSQWQIYPRERTEEEMKKEQELSDKDEEEFGMPPGLNAKAVEAFHGAMKEPKEKWIGRKPYVLLHVLATRPEYNRKGVGSVSMAWGTKQAEDLGLPAWLEGSPKGAGLYKKWGWEAVETLDFDARDHGYHDSLTHVGMFRKPNAGLPSS